MSVSVEEHRVRPKGGAGTGINSVGGAAPLISGQNECPACSASAPPSALRPPVGSLLTPLGCPRPLLPRPGCKRARPPAAADCPC
eukprot:7461869-Pyramimonas_sp.AAC.1